MRLFQAIETIDRTILGVLDDRLSELLTLLLVHDLLDVLGLDHGLSLDVFAIVRWLLLSGLLRFALLCGLFLRFCGLLSRLCILDGFLSFLGCFGVSLYVLIQLEQLRHINVVVALLGRGLPFNLHVRLVQCKEIRVLFHLLFKLFFLTKAIIYDEAFAAGNSFGVMHDVLVRMGVGVSAGIVLDALTFLLEGRHFIGLVRHHYEQRHS